MKHTKKTALTAAVLTAALSLTSCIGEDGVQDSFDPPVEHEQQTETSAETTANTAAITTANTTEKTTVKTMEKTTAASEEYEPSTEEIQDVYGPPADYEPPVEIAPETENTETETAVSEESEGVTAAEVPTSEKLKKPQDVQLVYGPPNDFQQ